MHYHSLCSSYKPHPLILILTAKSQMADLADIRTNNLFRDVHGDTNHLNVLTMRQYNRTDLVILVLVIFGTILVNRFILTKKQNKDDVS
jgi:hypothetical protein